MRTIWSRTTRPRLDVLHLLHHRTPIVPVIRQATSAPGRKTLRFSDAFTLLLAPVLATALIADTSWKDKKRKEWDTLIAEIEVETERLRASERQAWQNLQVRSIQSGVVFQKRLYSSVAQAYVVQEDEAAETGLEEMQLLPWEDMSEKSDVSSTKPELKEVDDETIASLRRLERLVAIKLAITMILHIHGGRSTRINPHEFQDPSLRPQNLDLLVRKLRETRGSIENLKVDLREREVTGDYSYPAQRHLNAEIRGLARAFDSKSITGTQLVEQFVQKLLQSRVAPSANGYVALFQILAKYNLDSLAVQVITAAKESRTFLSNFAIRAILLEYGKNKELHRLEDFLVMLTKSPREFNAQGSWMWKIVNGVQIPIPESGDPRLLEVLIFVALKCHQPHRAEAWAVHLQKQKGYEVGMSYVLSNFMQYYAALNDWRSGRKWLELANDWATVLASIAMRHFQRVIFKMLVLCFKCGKRREYDIILNAAVAARIGAFEMDASIQWRIWPHFLDICAEWRDRLNASQLDLVESTPAAAKAAIFQEHLRNELKTINATRAQDHSKGISVFRPPVVTGVQDARLLAMKATNEQRQEREALSRAFTEQQTQLTETQALLRSSKFKTASLDSEIIKVKGDLEHYKKRLQEEQLRCESLQQSWEADQTKLEAAKAELDSLKNDLQKYEHFQPALRKISLDFDSKIRKVKFEPQTEKSTPSRHPYNEILEAEHSIDHGCPSPFFGLGRFPHKSLITRGWSPKLV